VHSARRYLEALPADHVVVKLDFRNAFNSLHRSEMLLAVQNRIPDLYTYCFSAYSEPSVLFYGPYTVLSQEGPQQGDPLGPILFCSTIQPMLSSLECDLTLGYLDDVTLGGPATTVASDVSTIASTGDDMGTLLNAAKCELITRPDLSVKDPLLQSFVRVDVTNATLWVCHCSLVQCLTKYGRIVVMT